MAKKLYVAGFMFSPDFENVILIEKEKPEIGKEYWVRWNPNTENEDYKGKQITKEGYCIYGITHYKEI